MTENNEVIELDDNIQLEVLTPSAKLIDIKKLISDRIGNEQELYADCIYVIEHTGRICYNSYKEGQPQEEIGKFVEGAAKRGHRSIFEMGQLKFTIRLKTADCHGLYTLLSNNKYIKVKKPVYIEGETVFSMKGSPRAFIEILEDFCNYDGKVNTIDFYVNLYNCLSELIPVVLTNWETATSLTDHYNTLVELYNSIDFTSELLDITADYSNRDDFTKFLFLVQCDRSVTHEIVRHRPVSYLQASQRYIRYNNKNPYLICIGTEQKAKLGDRVAQFAKLAFDTYTELLKDNRPEDARLVLPNCTETKIFIYADKEEYRHFARMRQSKFAYPPIKEVFDQVYQQLIDKKYI